MIGDLVDEDQELFTLNVSGVTHATPGSLAAFGTINDDDAAPTISVDNGGCSVIEGDGGSRNCVFVVRLSAPSSRIVSFDSATVAGSATPDVDFSAHSGITRGLGAGLTVMPINVAVLGDTLEETDETFSLGITGVQNATPGALSGSGQILDDDSSDLLFFDGFE